jgi:hypothetical protein
MSTPDPALSALVSPPTGRARGLRGRLPTVPRTAAPEPGQPAVPPASLPSPAAQSPPRPKPDTPPEAPAAPSVRVVAARIPVSAFARLNEERAKTGETHEMWFLRAWARVDGQLDGHYRPPDSGGGRVPQRVRRRRRAAGEPLTQYALRLTEAEAAALFDRADELRPSSIAEFVTTIVVLALAGQMP